MSELKFFKCTFTCTGIFSFVTSMLLLGAKTFGQRDILATRAELTLTFWNCGKGVSPPKCLAAKTVTPK